MTIVIRFLQQFCFHPAHNPSHESDYCFAIGQKIVHRSNQFIILRYLSTIVASSTSILEKLSAIFLLTNISYYSGDWYIRSPSISTSFYLARSWRGCHLLYVGLVVASHLAFEHACSSWSAPSRRFKIINTYVGWSVRGPFSCFQHGALKPTGIIIPLLC